MDTIWRWSSDNVRALQNERFLEIVAVGWSNPFYRRRWSEAGLKPGDIRSIDDIGLIPTYNTDDIKDDQAQAPPFGTAAGVGNVRDYLKAAPSKGAVQRRHDRQTAIHATWPRGMGRSRAVVGAFALFTRCTSGDVVQLPATCSLSNLAWGMYNGCHNYLGAMPITTGSGIVTPTRKQLELAFDLGTNVWVSFPEYLMRLASVCQAELGRDIGELKTKLVATFLGPDLDGTLRKELEEAWNCPVYDQYGTNELGACRRRVRT